MGGGNVKRQERAEIVPETIYTHMSELLGASITSEVDAWHFVKQGISTKRYVILAERLRLAPDAVASISILRRRVKMLERRAKSPQVKRQRKTAAVQAEEARLTPAETERLMRLTRVVSEATQLFGDEKAALSWLNTPGSFLPGENEITPMKLAETDSGVRMVESMIQRTAHGLF